MSRRKTLMLIVVFVSMALFMALYDAGAAGKNWYLLALGLFATMSFAFILSYRWGMGSYEARVAKGLSLSAPAKRPWWVALISGSGLAIYNAGGPAYIVVVFFIPVFFGFVVAIMLVYYQRIAA